MVNFVISFKDFKNEEQGTIYDVSNMLALDVSRDIGLYRLCSATFEQLLEFWATFCYSSNLEQLLLPGATFYCLSNKRATFNHFKQRMDIWRMEM